MPATLEPKTGRPKRTIVRLLKLCERDIDPAAVFRAREADNQSDEVAGLGNPRKSRRGPQYDRLYKKQCAATILE